MNLPAERRTLLAGDITMIRKALGEFRYYDFPGSLSAAMREKGLSDSELGRRLGLSHSTISKWRSGDARPKGKERLKELGLALSLTEDEMNGFLLSMGYSPLYHKNPLDDACIFIIRRHSGDNAAALYKKYVDQFRVGEFKPAQLYKSIPTVVLQDSFAHVRTEAELETWLERYAASFSAFATVIVPNRELILCIMIFLGGATINELFEAGEFPAVIKNFLYPLVSGNELVLRGLRDKLIAFGLFRNMNADDIDRLLDLAKLRVFSRPGTPFEAAALIAVRQAHARFPLYEYDYLGDAAVTLEDALRDAGLRPFTDSVQRRKSFYTALFEEISERLNDVEKLAGAYLSPGGRDDDDAAFEEAYTAYSGADDKFHREKCLADYVRDIIDILVEDGDIQEKDVRAFREQLQL
ncbi:MAG: helix-turn-helix domain-containing protein [Treponema sp.]|jgi:transcriptional regulator with XRE-family HTH domain|nr:helix-turn-helix domain-containing protein [Treponema sp.]